MKREKMTGDEKPVSGGREVLELPVGVKVDVALRGGGVYEGGDAIDLVKYRETGEKVLTGEKIKNAALIVCDAERPDDVYTLSANVNTVLGRSIMSFLQRDDEGKFWLKKEFLNVRGKLGKVERDSKEGYDKKMEMLTWEPGKKMKGLPEEAETVGADQKEDLTAEGETVI